MINPDYCCRRYRKDGATSRACRYEPLVILDSIVKSCHESSSRPAATERFVRQARRGFAMSPDLSPQTRRSHVCMSVWRGVFELMEQKAPEVPDIFANNGAADLGRRQR